MRWRSHAAAHYCIRACATALTLALGGCSFSYQLDNLFAKADEGIAQRGSLHLSTPKPLAQPPSEADLTIARTVAGEVLSKGGKDVSMPWENPRTGARGTVTPLASAYTQDGSVCRDFLASYVKEGSEAWLHGAGCRAQRGKWQVRSMRPWKNSSDVKTSPKS
ncbi:MAG TPA: RT0821/Lpp0805 family surface protein [Xanthobacteraceae bacterium]|jgi:surface antigen